MTYRPAAAPVSQAVAARRNRQTAGIYRTAGVPAAEVAVYRTLGVPPRAAGVLVSLNVTPALRTWFASTYSRRDLRRMFAPSRRPLLGGSLARWKEMHVRSPDQTFGWAHHTEVSMEDALRLNEWGVSPSLAALWWERQPPMAQHLRLVAIIEPAVAMYGLSASDVAGWVQFAVTHRVYALHEHGFLGGFTALMLQAGLGPFEADMLTVRQQVDHDGLAALAALRGSR